MGFLGTGAPFSADVNLVVQVIMAIALGVGAVLARRKLYRAHAITQVSVLLLNLVMIAWVMVPSTRMQVLPAIPHVMRKAYLATPALHAGLGILAEMMGIYIALVAGTNWIPQWGRFRNWKVWMRVELGMWWVAVGSGVATYYVWYIAPFRR